MLLAARYWSKTPDPKIQKARIVAKNGYWWYKTQPAIHPDWVKQVAPLVDFNPKKAASYSEESIKAMDAAMELFFKPPKVIDKVSLFKILDSELLDPYDGEQICLHPYLRTLNRFPQLMAAAASLRGLHTSPENYKDLQTQAVNSHYRLVDSYHVWKSGEQVFRISPDLVDALLLTEVTGLRWEDLKLPFPAFVIEFPNPPIYGDNPETGRHWFDTFMIGKIHHLPFAEDAKSLQAAIESERRKDPFGYPAMPNSFEYGEGICCSMWGRENENSRGAMDDEFCFHNLFQPRDGNLDTSIAAIGAERDWESVLGTPVDTKTHAAKLAVNLMINIILYINSRPEDVIKEAPNPRVKELHTKLGKRPTKSQKKELLKELHQLSGRPRAFVVGTHVTIDKRLKGDTHATGTGRTPSVASYVRGNWRNQAHGPQHSLRRLQWIEPFWRNLQAEAVSQKTYIVEAKT